MYWTGHDGTKTLAATLVACCLLSCTPATAPVTVSPADAEWPEYARDKAGHQVLTAGSD